ncbi:MAG: hypothetical protein R3C11_15770 [Planctomycetaceae bacterium]
MQRSEHCGPAMWHTSAVVGVGLLMLAPADLLLVCRFGWLMAALVGTVRCWLTLVFLPASCWEDRWELSLSGPLKRPIGTASQT